ncbi:hypothetical protein LTS18_003860, partial [Coniosporium uncinatum]
RDGEKIMQPEGGREGVIVGLEYRIPRSSNTGLETSQPQRAPKDKASERAVDGWCVQRAASAEAAVTTNVRW